MTSVAALLRRRRRRLRRCARRDRGLAHRSPPPRPMRVRPAIELLGAFGRRRRRRRSASLRAPRGDGDRAEGGPARALAASLLECAVPPPRHAARRCARRARAPPRPRRARRRRGGGGDARAAHHREAGTLVARCVLRALADVRLRLAVGDGAAAEGGVLPRLLPMLGSVRYKYTKTRSLAFLRLSRVASTRRLPALCSRPASCIAPTAPPPPAHTLSTSGPRASTAPTSGARRAARLRPRVPPGPLRRRRGSNCGRAAERATAVRRHAARCATPPLTAALGFGAEVSGALELLFVQWLAAREASVRAAGDGPPLPPQPPLPPPRSMATRPPPPHVCSRRSRRRSGTPADGSPAAAAPAATAMPELVAAVLKERDGDVYARCAAAVGAARLPLGRASSACNLGVSGCRSPPSRGPRSTTQKRLESRDLTSVLTLRRRRWWPRRRLAPRWCVRCDALVVCYEPSRHVMQRSPHVTLPSTRARASVSPSTARRRRPCATTTSCSGAPVRHAAWQRYYLVAAPTPSAPPASALSGTSPACTPMTL